jgi:hypothetical protein
VDLDLSQKWLEDLAEADLMVNQVGLLPSSFEGLNILTKALGYRE